MDDVIVGSARAAELRNRLADLLVADGTIRSGPVEAAIRLVPRHLFAPEPSVEDAYARSAIVTKRDEHGVAISSVSAPEIQAMMLEQAGIRAGMRVLEIGSGGYNAALIAEIVGPDGEVTTLDIDPEVVGRARSLLSDAGYGQVNVVLSDGERGCPERAPYDCLLVTVGAWDISPAWIAQLREGGTLVVPLRMCGLTRSVAFERHDDHLVSRSAEVCGFVEMQGSGQHSERLLLLRGKEVGLRFDDGPPPEAGLLDGIFEGERTEVWSTVRVSRVEPFDTLQMWLATALDGFCLMAVDRDLDTGVVAPVNRMASPAVVEGRTLVHLTVRKVDEHSVELGVHGFGPDAAALAEAVAEQVRVWDRDHRGGPGPTIAFYPAPVPAGQLPTGRVISKRHGHVLISWPTTNSRS